MVSLTGESLSGAGISHSKLTGAASRMGLMELTARLNNLSAVQVAGSRRQVWDTGYISLCSLGNWVNSSLLALVLRLVCKLLVDIKVMWKSS